MDWRLELVQVSVSNVDRAKACYIEQAGFTEDHDHQVDDALRFDQLKLLGKGCSIALGTGFDWGSFAFFSDPDGNGWAVQ
ncbi:MAG: hypothetical protein H0V94_07635 [Actinobacteria bacterium]|nr:hypothetical protein [Actinomycetota bacterium]